MNFYCRLDNYQLNQGTFFAAGNQGHPNHRFKTKLSRCFSGELLQYVRHN